MFWYGTWDPSLWLIFPIIMCVAMMAMMMLMGRGRMGRGSMGWCGGGHDSESSSAAPLETLRQRFANGELTQQEYEEQRNLLLRD